MTPPPVTPFPVKFVAGPDGIAHAYPPRGRGRSLCGWPRVPAYMEHPWRDQCAECRRRLGLLPIGEVAT